MAMRDFRLLIAYLLALHALLSNWGGGGYSLPHSRTSDLRPYIAYLLALHALLANWGGGVPLFLTPEPRIFALTSPFCMQCMHCMQKGGRGVHIFSPEQERSFPRSSLQIECGRIPRILLYRGSRVNHRTHSNRFHAQLHTGQSSAWYGSSDVYPHTGQT